MDYFLDNWGSFVGLVGVITSLAGLTASLVAVQRAGKARDAAAAAEVASQQTREAIAGVLTVVDLERAIALIQRIKVLHRDGNWEVSLEHYQPLRAMLADIDGRHPSLNPMQHTILRDAILQLTDIEDTVARARPDGAAPSQEGNFNEALNTIQASLERIASSTYFARSEGDQ